MERSNQTNLSRCVDVRAGEAQHRPSVGAPLERRLLLIRGRVRVMRGEREKRASVLGSV